jgi:amino acid permease
MKNKLQKSLIPFIGITLILIAVLSKRLFIKNLNMDSLLSFIAGFAVILICFLIFKIVLKNKK